MSDATPDLFATQEPPPAPCGKCGGVVDKKHDDEECGKRREFREFGRRSWARCEWPADSREVSGGSVDGGRVEE